jgi:hypothetical protein
MDASVDASLEASVKASPDASPKGQRRRQRLNAQEGRSGAGRRAGKPKTGAGGRLHSGLLERLKAGVGREGGSVSANAAHRVIAPSFWEASAVCCTGLSQDRFPFLYNRHRTDPALG